MSNLNQFIGKPPVSTITNSFPLANGIQIASAANIATNTPITAALSGAMTANTLKTALTLSGAGTLDIFAATSADATVRAIRVKITIDGVVAYDKTASATATTSYGVLAVGSVHFDSASTRYPVPDPMTFNTSCLVEISSSFTETDKMNVFYQYKKY